MAGFSYGDGNAIGVFNGGGNAGWVFGGFRVLVVAFGGITYCPSVTGRFLGTVLFGFTYLGYYGEWGNYPTHFVTFGRVGDYFNVYLYFNGGVLGYVIGYNFCYGAMFVFRDCG